MTSVFEVSVAVVDTATGRIEGAELERLTKFLRMSEGAALFDLEYDGRLFRKCRIHAAEPSTALLFSFERSTVPEPIKSDPNATYR